MSLQIDEQTPQTEKEPSPLLKHRGRFRISRHLIQRHPEDLMTILSGMVVIEASSKWEGDCIEYLALCERFEPLDEYIMAPFYHLNLRKDGEAVSLDGVTRAES
jgi:hypothetical protein